MHYSKKKLIFSSPFSDDKSYINSLFGIADV